MISKIPSAFVETLKILTIILTLPVSTAIPMNSFFRH